MSIFSIPADVVAKIKLDIEVHLKEGAARELLLSLSTLRPNEPKYRSALEALEK